MSHATKARQFLEDEKNADWHDQALWFLRQKRDRAVAPIAEWETLRDYADQIKGHTLTKLDHYLIQFEENAQKKNITVHWAADAKEHNQIVLSIAQKHGAKHIVKSKSMLTEECHLNHYLEANDIEVVDTDLGERIIQFRNEPPSHIVVPAIHLKKEDVGQTFETHLNTEKGNADPLYLTRSARAHLREKFIHAQIGITGANFLIAETGSVVVCTNEGNADLGTSLPPVHIVSAGIEKVIPTLDDLSIFIRMLARSATGQSITTYTSHFHRPRQNSEMHVILVDNGRSEILGSKDFRKSLQCIRCGACMNTCPVYRNSGGHSYHNVIPGPIGSVLAPHEDPKNKHSLPYASTLCGSCTNVCPVKIDLHQQLVKWRSVLTAQGYLGFRKKMLTKGIGLVLGSPTIYKFISFLMKLMRFVPKSMINSKINPWAFHRKTPEIPKKTFKELYAKRNKK